VLTTSIAVKCGKSARQAVSRGLAARGMRIALAAHAAVETERGTCTLLMMRFGRVALEHQSLVQPHPNRSRNDSRNRDSV
jgi:hypothetical protein